MRAPGEAHHHVLDLHAATLDQDILVIVLVLAGGRGDIALAPEAAADVGRKLPGRDDMVAIVVGRAGQPLAQEISEEAARLEPAGDEAGQILLRAEQAHHIGAVDQIAEAARKAGIERDDRKPGMDAAEQGLELGIAHRRVAQLDRLGAPVQLGGADRHVDLVAMAREEEEEGVIRPGRGGGAREGVADILGRRFGIGQQDAGRVEQAGGAQAVVELAGIVVGIGQIAGPPAIIGDADQQGDNAGAARYPDLARMAGAGRQGQAIIAGFVAVIGGGGDDIVAILGEHGVEPAVGRDLAVGQPRCRR